MNRPLSARAERRIHRIFQISLLLKAAHSVLEIAGGILLFAVSTDTVLRIVDRLTQDELSQDPHDRIANFLLHAARNLSVDAKSSAAFFLLSHGAVKLFLIVAVLRGKSWAYPAFMLALAGLIVYQTDQLLHVTSIGLAALTVLDAIVLVLTWHEYRFAILARRHAQKEEGTHVKRPTIESDP